MVCNKKMKKILNEKNLDVDVQLIEKTCSIILSKIKRLKSHDCIIYDENDETAEPNFNWDCIFRICTDLTGFEMSCNEILINIYLEYDKRSLGSVISNLLKCFKTAIKNRYPNKQFFIIIYEDSGNLFLRFHIYRESEGFWVGNVEELERRVEKDENPTLYEFV